MVTARQKRRLVVLAKKMIMKRGRNSYDGNGVASLFFKLTESFGLKLTRHNDKTGTLSIFRRQRKAWRFGLGPYCFGFQEYQMKDMCGDVDSYFGYITEIVAVHSEHIGRAMGRRIIAATMQGKKLLRMLETRIAFSFHDCHGNNLGVKNGQWVCIDFGIDY